MELSVGQTARRELAITAAMVERYAEITGDRNPLLFDEAFAGATRFGGLIAQGGIATGLLHALVAMDMPGAGTVFTKQSWAFPKPVYIGDTIRAEAVVLRVHARLPMADLGFTVTNQREETVLTGEATIYQASPEPRCWELSRRAPHVMPWHRGADRRIAGLALRPHDTCYSAGYRSGIAE